MEEFGLKPTFYSHRKRVKTMLAVLLSFTLLFGLLSSLAAKPAQAKSSSRLAIVTEVGGTVTVQSAGASNAYDAYEGMSLNQGDYITTGSDSYAVLSIKDTDDQITIGAYAEVYISDLASSGSGKKSKLKMWAGSLWTSVKKLAGADEFEVETPTAVMGVRGTNVAFGVDPETGETFAAVASGTVTAESTVGDDEEEGTSEGGGDKTLLSPSQQYQQTTNKKSKNAEDNVSTVDIEALVSRISSRIVQAMVESSNAINEENDEYIQQQEEALDKGEDNTTTRDGATSSLKAKSKEELQKLKQNFQNIVGNVVNTAITTGVVDATKILEVIDKTNESAPDDKKLDLNNVKPLDKTAGLDPELEAKKQAERERVEQERKAKLEQQKQELDKLLKELEAALNKLKEEQKRLEAERKAAEQAAKDKAAAELAAKLSAEEKARFEADKKAADQKKAEQAAASASPSATPTPTPSASPSPTPSSNSGESSPTPIPSPITFSKNKVTLGLISQGVSHVVYQPVTISVNSASGLSPSSIQWSNNEYVSVATDSLGHITLTPKKKGTTTLTATAPGFSGTITVNVFEASVSLPPSSPAPSSTPKAVVTLSGAGEIYGAEVHFEALNGMFNYPIGTVSSEIFAEDGSGSSAYAASIGPDYDTMTYAAMFVPGVMNHDYSFSTTGTSSKKLVELPMSYSNGTNISLFRLMIVSYDGTVVLDYTPLTPMPS